MLGLPFLVLSTILLSVAQCEGISNVAMKSFRSQLINSTQKCTEKYKIAAIEVLNMIGQDILPPREAAKCYFLCMMQEFNLMDEKGTFNEVKLENLMNYFPKNSKYTETVENRLDTCLTAAKNLITQQPKYDGCNRAYTLVKCMYDKKSTSQVQNTLSEVGKKVTGILPSVPMPSIPQIPTVQMPAIPQLPKLQLPSAPQIPTIPKIF